MPEYNGCNNKHNFFQNDVYMKIASRLIYTEILTPVLIHFVEFSHFENLQAKITHNDLGAVE
jgi:hypothetical protein